MSKSGDTPKSFSKKVETNKVAFKSPSRFSGGGAQSQFGTKSQYKPMPVRITQHKG